MFPKTKLLSLSLISTSPFTVQSILATIYYTFLILNLFVISLHRVNCVEYDPASRTLRESATDDDYHNHNRLLEESFGSSSTESTPRPLRKLISLVRRSSSTYANEIPLETESTVNVPVKEAAETLPGPCTKNCLEPTLVNELKPKCPNILNQILVDTGFFPYNISVGEFRAIKELTTVDGCTRRCCEIEGCSVAMMIDTICFLVFCNKGPEACLPQPIPKSSPTMSFNDLYTVYLRIPLDISRKGSTCEVGIDSLCKGNEVCRTTNHRSRNGRCECEEQFLRTTNEKCVPIPPMTDDDMKGGESSETGTQLPLVPSTVTQLPPSPTPAFKTLQVSVKSLNITLPTNEATLYAYAVPEESADNPYSYSWALVSHPASDPTQIEGQTTNSLKLTKLIQGTYIFQITVTSAKANANGTANAAITVFPEKRANSAPIAVISPAEQTVQLPTSSAVLDASSSTDDDKIISYKWELQGGPIEYRFDASKQSINSSTLQVKDLIPGNYVFKLTVEDTDHVTNFTTGNVTVMKEIDYPPTANAGNDVVIFLPQTEAILNGNASSDDKKIAEWEWKASGDTINAVDIQDTHTPYLKLSHLQEGIYQFELRVTDEAGQHSKPSTVHVFVKPPTGNPPTAVAGKPQTIALPQNWVILDASESTGDSKIVKWKWNQLNGPNNASIEKPDEVKTNVTGLTKGDYEFEVEIENEVKLSAKAHVNISVAQKKNDPPKANAGEDKTVTLPISLVQLDGSGSTDDVKVTNWQWTREPDSSVAGLPLGKSETMPVLQLTDLIAGKYVFNLTVKDEQGLSDSDTVVLVVKEDPSMENLVEIVIGVPLTSWTQTDKEKFFQQITLLLKDTKPIFHHVAPQLHSGFVVVTLYGTNESGVAPALSLTNELRKRLHQDSGILEFPAISVDTVLCLDHCSEHGKCEDLSNQRICNCDAFWMENFFKRHYGTGERNCEWSKIYVVVISCFLLIMIYALFWSLIFLYRRSRRVGGVLKESIIGTSNGGRLTFSSSRNGSVNKRHNHSQKKQYTLLGDEEIDMEEVTGIELDTEESDSDVSLVEVKRTSKGNSLVVKNTLSSESSAMHSLPNSSNNGLKRNGILKQPRQNIKA